MRPLERAALGDSVPPQDRARRARLICEDLGPTFIKLGQVLSTRSDLLAEAYTRELAKLREEARPFAFEEARTILESELHGEIETLFQEIASEPVASASISQVHRAVLPNGAPVAVKIQRPGIAKTVRADLEILKNIAHLIEHHVPDLAVHRPSLIVREFERSLHRELDFVTERKTIQRCGVLLSRDPTVRVPEIYPEYCTTRVLTMEYVEGLVINDVETLRAHGIDPEEVARRGGRILARQIFEYGLFHADPHSGNMRVLPGNVIAMLDYGMFGQLDLTTRERIADLLDGLMRQDLDRVLRAVDDLNIRGEEVDEVELRRDVSMMISSYADLTLDSIELGTLLSELMQLIRTHGLRLPPDLVLLIRSLITIESVGRTLDPHFDIAAQLGPVLHRVHRQRYQPKRLVRESAQALEDLRRTAMLLPDVLNHSLESIRRGELTLKFDLTRFETLVGQLIRASNSLTAGIVIAGLIIGSSLIVVSSEPSSGSIVLGYGGFSIAMILTIWLLWNMFHD